MAPFAGAIFLGALLLFLVQPLAGRFVLPWFGGAAGIWTVCLLFFQTALFGGYVYAHLLGRYLSPRRQVAAHLGLLIGALLWLPPVLEAPAIDAATHHPVSTLLLLLLRDLGPLFLLLAATGPLVQAWFHTTHPHRSPYGLYALSNTGSLLGLLLYPFALEPWLGRSSQAWLWATGFVGFVAMIAWAARSVLRATGDGDVTSPPQATSTAHAPAVRWSNRATWFLLAFLGTAFLAATSAALTADVAPVPFLWVLPLVVYLVSFIATFRQGTRLSTSLMFALLVCAATVAMELRTFGSQLTFIPFFGLHLFTLTVACWFCHGRLYQARPAPQRLTDFYLTLSAGGAAGTLTIAVLSPRWTQLDLDLPLLWSGVLIVAGIAGWRHPTRAKSRALWTGLVGALLIVPWLRPTILASPWEHFIEFYRHQPALIVVLIVGLMLAGASWWHRHLASSPLFQRTAALVVAGACAGYFTLTACLATPDYLVSRRGFHGVITVAEYTHDDARANARFMNHGTTTHGIQLQHPDYRHYPTSYYTPDGGIGRAMIRENQHPHRHIGVVGLGVGTLAAYGMPGDTIRFFEIDPHVIDIAWSHFYFLADTDATVDVVLGDGRLQLAREERQQQTPRYDMLLLDAFSGDAVPTHLLTREAFELYARRLRPDGVLVINISNRLIDLRRAIEGNARAGGWYLAHMIHRPSDGEWWQFASEWLLLSRRRESLDTPAITNWTGIASPATLDGPLWTDEYSSLLPVLR